MIRQCAWCSRIFGHAAPLDNPSVTHGVCEECYAKFMQPSEGRPESEPPGGGASAPPIVPTDASL